MAELGFALVLAVIAGVVAAMLAREGEPAFGGERPRALVALAAVALGLLILRFGGVFVPELRARVLGAVGAFVLGLGAAVAHVELRGRLPRASIRGAAASVMIAPVLAAASICGIALLATRQGGASMLTPLAFAWSFGATVGSLLAASTEDSFSLVALTAAALLAAFVSFGAANASTLESARHPRGTLPALGPVLIVLPSLSLAVAAMSVQRDDGEDDDAPRLRGFAVATTVMTLGVVAATHWWARPSGRGAWLALPALAAAIGSVLVRLVGRYYDDPLHRPGKALARARRGGPRTRLRVGAQLGAEGALVVLAVALAIAWAAFRAAALLGLARSGEVGIAVALATALGSRSYLDAVALAEAGEARTVAHDVLCIALATALLSRMSSRVALAALPIVAGLIGAAILERIASSHGEDGAAEELRRRAALLPVLASGALAGVLAFAWGPG